jgi:aspartyl-tRNA(Asn)/glutamyl-tRNA(Gln) amidotransferase subunit A
VTRELALAQAKVCDEELKTGHWRGPLHVIPVALKDNVDTAGIRTTAASALRAEHVPAEDATVYARLRDAGAVLLGKLNMHEFAYGGTSAISHFDAVHNPWDLERIPGSSSDGSAAAVAARLCMAALGTDTLASILGRTTACGRRGKYNWMLLRRSERWHWAKAAIRPVARRGLALRCTRHLTLPALRCRSRRAASSTCELGR